MGVPVNVCRSVSLNVTRLTMGLSGFVIRVNERRKIAAVVKTAVIRHFEIRLSAAPMRLSQHSHGIRSNLSPYPFCATADVVAV
jgi:hypothetical protein